jgi:hypothetical protein
MRAIISFDVTKAWECWSIDVDDEHAPEELTPEWLAENPDKWDLNDIKDRGYHLEENLRVEEVYD